MSESKPGRMKPFAKFAIVVVVLIICYFGFTQLSKSGALNAIIPQGNHPTANTKSPVNGIKPINVGVVTWGGYAGGEYFNGGFTANTNSNYYKDYGLLVNFVVLDDYNASREAWKSGAVDLLWSTADSFCTETPNMSSYDPRIVFQSDWSRGGDAIVVREGINKVEDLKGKKVSVAFGTPSHTFLLWLLDAAGMSYSDIQVVEVQNAVDSAAMFKAEKVDAAVCWSPDDDDCVNTIKGSKVLKNTREAAHIIADVFYAKESWINSHQKELSELIEGWMKGAADINTSETAKYDAAKILSIGLNQPVDFCKKAINNTRLTTFGDNQNFFNLNGNYNGVTGEKLYSKMSDLYTQIGLIHKNVPQWRLVIDATALRNVNLQPADGQEAETEKQFSKVDDSAGKQMSAYASKQITISFNTGSYSLSDDAKRIIRKDFVPIAQAFTGSRVRVAGNTDNTGDPEYNRTLSYQRAKAAIDYLVSNYKFNRNRFIPVGNGPDNPVDSNDTDEGRAKNRRTDFELLNSSR